MGKTKSDRRSRRPKQPSRPRDAAPPGPGKDAAPGGRRRGLRPVVGIMAIALLAGAAAVISFFSMRGDGARVVREERLNVLLITLDTTRADSLGCYGFTDARTPHLDGLARGGVLFARAYCQVPLTLPSHASILTGLYPFRHGVHNNGTYTLGPGPATLAAVLKGLGYETAAFTASFSVDSRFGLDRGFDVYDDTFEADSPVKAYDSERRAEAVAAAFASWLEPRGRDRFFAWVHFFDPHLPYDPPEPYRREFASRPYDGEIAYMDHHVGRIVGLLEDKGLLDRTLIVVAGDHGEAFGEKGESGHGIFIYEPTVHVPLILWAGERLPAGRVVESRARLIDILPTVLDLLGAPAVEGIDGGSLVPRIRRRRSASPDAFLETFYPRENHGWSELTGLLSGPWKYIQAPRPELYHLGDDPGEEKNLVSTEAGRAAELEARLAAAVRNAVGADAGQRSLSGEEQEKLRALGYVQFAGRTGDREDYPDPKDKIDEFRLFQEALVSEQAGDFAAAERIYEKLLALYPEVAESYVNLSQAQARQNKFEATLETLNRGAVAVPGSETILSRLGHTYLFVGRPDEALRTMRRLLEMNPEHFDALTVCAMALNSQGRIEEARGYIERALRIEPENKFLRTSLARGLMSSGRLGEAVEAFSGLVRDHPADAYLHLNLGLAHGMAGDLPRAIEHLGRSVALEPTPSALYNLAYAYRENGQLREAVGALERYLAFPGNDDQEGIRSARAEIERLRSRLK